MGMGLCDGMGEDITDARNGSGSGTGSNSGCGSESVPGLIRPIELNDFCKYGEHYFEKALMKCLFVQLSFCIFNLDCCSHLSIHFFPA